MQETKADSPQRVPSGDSEGLKQRNVRIPEDLWSSLRDAAAVATVQRGQQVSRAQVVREACRQYVEELLPEDGDGA